MTLATYEKRGNVGLIRLDDGKVNAMSPAMLHDVNVALDSAESDGVVVVMTGRATVFSAGFDLQILSSAGDAAASMVIGGFELAYRLLSYSRPVVMACPGHAIAMGSFLLLSGDYRIGTSGPAKFTANEVAIGLTMPRAAVELLRHRLTPAAFTRATLLADVFTSESAVDAGFLDRIVPSDELLAIALGEAERFAALDATAHANTKERARRSQLVALRQAIDEDRAELQKR